MKNVSQIMFRFVAILAVSAALVSAGQTQAYGVVINEFLERNDNGIVDDYNSHSDWIELYNPEAAPFNMDGYYLTDDPFDLTKWQFPAVVIPADGHLLVFASGRDGVGPGGKLHTNFKLSSSGEYIGLVEPDGWTIAHGFSYPDSQSPDVSYGLFPDGDPSEYYMPPSPDARNIPEPSSLVLLTIAMSGLITRFRRRY